MYILNGKVYKDEENQISVSSQAFMFGYGLFETLKVSKGHILFFDEHLKRLEKGCKTLDLTLNTSHSKIKEDCYRLLEFKNINDGVLKILYAKGNCENYLTLTTRKNSYTKSDYQKGFKIMFSDLKRNQYSLLTFVKSNNYMENLIAKQRAKKLGFDEVLFLNTDDFVCEGAVSNIFWIKDNIIYTPSISCGLLPGIIREKILIVLKRLGLEVKVGTFTKSDIMSCDQAFITNSVMDIMPVSQIEDYNISIEENPILSKIINEYNYLVGEDYE